jgi:hypothetical protein
MVDQFHLLGETIVPVRGDGRCESVTPIGNSDDRTAEGEGNNLGSDF